MATCLGMSSPLTLSRSCHVSTLAYQSDLHNGKILLNILSTGTFLYVFELSYEI